MVADLVSARVDAASIELNNITNINENIDILSNSVELSNQSAIKRLQALV